MNGPQYFHLTVSPEGVISLWDDEERAREGKAENEAYVKLVLTAWQSETLVVAQQIAKGERPNGPDLAAEPTAKKR